jgi:hypothetical protein
VKIKSNLPYYTRRQSLLKEEEAYYDLGKGRNSLKGGNGGTAVKQA